MADIALQTMIKDLSEVGDIAWGMYAFSRDILCNKVDSVTKESMIKKAISCGYKKADEVMQRFGTNEPQSIAEELRLKVEYVNKGQIADRVLFALFTPPDLIQIMEEPVKKAVNNPDLMGFISEEEILSLILGHEIFHYLEEEDEEIYTRTEKIALWKFFGYTNRSTIRALSEIAGMSFTKRLNSFLHSPFALDVILYYNYNTEEAERIYRDVLSFR